MRSFLGILFQFVFFQAQNQSVSGGFQWRHPDGVCRNTSHTNRYFNRHQSFTRWRWSYRDGEQLQWLDHRGASPHSSSPANYANGPPFVHTSWTHFDQNFCRRRSDDGNCYVSAEKWISVMTLIALVFIFHTWEEPPPGLHSLRGTMSARRRLANGSKLNHLLKKTKSCVLGNRSRWQEAMYTFCSV